MLWFVYVQRNVVTRIQVPLYVHFLLFAELLLFIIIAGLSPGLWHRPGLHSARHCANRRKGCASCFEVAVCTVVWLITYLEWQAFYPHLKHFLSLGSTGSMGNPCPKQLKRQHDFGKIRPKAIILKWSKPIQQWSFMWAVILALNIWPWKLNNWISEVKKRSFHHE